MHALCFENDAVVLREREPPEPRAGEALVGMRLAGICGTDLEVTRGYRGYRGILGHEFVGEVLRSPGVPQWVGRRVVGEINLACGRCERCHAGLGKHCAQRRVMGIVGHPGCFADRLTLPVANLHEVPAAVTDEQAVFTEPLAAAFEVLESVPLGPDTRTAVLGDGRLGLLIVMALQSRGIPVVAVGRHPDKLAHVAALGVPIHAPNAATSELPYAAFDLVVEATGSSAGLDRALALVRPRGTVVLKSTVHGTATLDTARVVVDEIRLVGSRCGPFDVALAALADGSVDPRPLVDARYPLAQGEAAMAHAARRGTLKVLLQGPG